MNALNEEVLTVVCHLCHLKQFPPWQLPRFLEVAGSGSWSCYPSSKSVALPTHCINVIFGDDYYNGYLFCI